MTEQEARRLLNAIKLAYPHAYRDMNPKTADATVKLWAVSFPDLPYKVMEQAFHHYRMVSKFPPTVAEMVEELERMHYRALEAAQLFRMMGDQNMAQRWMNAAAMTEGYRREKMTGGMGNGIYFGTPGNWLDGGDGLPQLGPGPAEAGPGDLGG